MQDTSRGCSMQTASSTTGTGAICLLDIQNSSPWTDSPVAPAMFFLWVKSQSLSWWTSTFGGIRSQFWMWTSHFGWNHRWAAERQMFSVSSAVPSSMSTPDSWMATPLLEFAGRRRYSIGKMDGHCGHTFTIHQTDGFCDWCACLLSSNERNTNSYCRQGRCSPQPDLKSNE